MLTLLMLTAVLATTTSYPGFGDHGVLIPRRIESRPKVQAARDLGPILELTVRCGSGVAIMSYSKMDRLYCAPHGNCDRDLGVAYARSCR
jgi:hypothetical protein